jgi:hypothetical protein
MRASPLPIRAAAFRAPVPDDLPDIGHLLDERNAGPASFDASYGFALPELLPRRLADLVARSRAC